MLRSDPPELIRGDYVELLPEVLADRAPAVITVVYETASTVYLSRERYGQLVETLVQGARAAPLAWISTRQTFEQEGGGRGWKLELALLPDGERRVVVLAGPHGESLEWRG